MALDLTTISAEALRNTPDSLLQGVSDLKLRQTITKFPEEEMVQLCLLGVSGKVRHIAHQIVGKKLPMSALKFVRENLDTARKRYKKYSAKEVQRLIEIQPEGSNDEFLLKALFREKAEAELGQLPMEKLYELQEKNTDEWPAEIIAGIINTRRAPPSKSGGDWWREQT